MELALLNTSVLLVVILIQWVNIRTKNKAIADLELDNAFWLKEAQLYSIELHELKNKTAPGK